MRITKTLAAIETASLVALVGCGGATPGEGEPTETASQNKEIVVGWTPPQNTGVFQTATEYFEKGAEEAGKHSFNVRILTKAPTSHSDSGGQVKIIEDFISSGVDVIAISPADTDSIVPALREAKEAGIPVIMINMLEELPGVEAASYIGFDNREAAQVSGYAVLDYFGGPGVLGAGEKVDLPEDGYLDLDWWEALYADADLSGIEANGVMIEGLSGTLFANERNAGFQQVIELAPNVTILANPIAGNWEREKGTAAAEDFLTRFGADELDFMWTANNEMGLGAAAAVQQAGRLNTAGGEAEPESGKIALFMNDLTPESADQIRKGAIIAETHHGFPEWGWLGAATAVQLSCGLEVEMKQDIRPRTVYQGNVDDFYPGVTLPEVDWASIAENCQ